MVYSVGESETIKYIDSSVRAFEDAQLSLSGSPRFSFEFIGVPSVNTHYNKHFRPRSIETGEWRYEAKEKALWALWGQKKRPAVQRALVLVDVWIPHEGVMDIHNVNLKPILDGFSEAGLWTDDEWAFVPIVITRWAGIRSYKPREPKKNKILIHVYDLQFFNLRGQYQKLPKGRTWVNDKKSTPLF